MSHLLQTSRGRLRTITTPEDLPLPLPIASAAARITAFGIDFLAMTAITVAIALLVFLGAGWVGFLGGGSGGAFFLAVFLLVRFFLWNGWFLYFELRWLGRTPGKKQVDLRVVSRDGGPLTVGAVFARNLMRELEFYLPLVGLLAPEMLWGEAPGWALLIASGWLLLFLFFPLFNRDRLRVGDLVGGTMVVVQPDVHLLEDMATARSARVGLGGLPPGEAGTDAGRTDANGRPATEEGVAAATDAVAADAVVADERWQFTAAQLDMYGIRELQVLEKLLREVEERPERVETLALVAEKIRAKIAWRDDVPTADVLPFLRAFYRAQRRRLEQRLLMGERREHKKSGKLR